MQVTMLGYGTSFWDAFPNPCSGREIQIWGIARELARRGHEVTLVKAGEADGTTTVDGVDVVSLRHGQARTAFQNFQDGSLMSEALSFSRKASSYLEGVRPDVLCLHYGISSSHLESPSIPRSYTLHVADVMFSARRDFLQGDFAHYPHTVFNSLMERRSAKRADGLVVLNQKMSDYIHQAWRRPAQVIPCGVDEERFTDLGDDRYIVYAGRLDRNKNAEHLVEAYAALPASVRREYGLKIVGSGENEGVLRALVLRRGLGDRVEFVPWAGRERVASIIGSCSILVLPSLVETFGIVLIEAMACSKPVLAYDISGPQDIVTPGENGCLARPENVMDLSRKLLHLLQDPGLRKRMGARGRAEVETRFTFGSVGGKYEALLKGLVREAVEPVPVPPSASSEAASVK